MKPVFGYGKTYNDYGNASEYCILHWLAILLQNREFDRIQFIRSETAKSSEWYAPKMLRDKTARREYFDVEKNRRQRGDLYITQIMDEEINADDPRLR